MARTRHEMIEELQIRLNNYLEEGEEDEAYWVEQELQELYREQEIEELEDERELRYASSFLKERDWKIDLCWDERTHEFDWDEYQYLCDCEEYWGE